MKLDKKATLDQEQPSHPSLTISTFCEITLTPTVIVHIEANEKNKCYRNNENHKH